MGNYIDIGVSCDVGDRRKINEDSIFIKTNFVKNQEIGIFCVADGMGGMEAGDKASKFVVDTMLFWWEHRFLKMLIERKPIGDILEDLDKTILMANYQLLSRSGKMGTTLSILLLIGDIYVIRNIGDSRIYLINKKIAQLTVDHSYIEELQKRGLLTENEMKFHPKRNIITSCIGLKEKIDIFRKMGKINIDDIFLLCSDGFHSIITDAEILKIIFDRRFFTMQDKVTELRKLIKKGQASDNVSIILCQPVRNTKEN